jgi:two-component system sensor histidine kinase KdpD
VEPAFFCCGQHARVRFFSPTFSFDVEDTRYIFTLFVMLVVAVVMTPLMISIQRHRESADARERRTAGLYAVSRELTSPRRSVRDSKPAR